MSKEGKAWVEWRRRRARSITAFVCVWVVALAAAGSVAAAPVQIGGAGPAVPTCVAGFWHVQVGEATVSYTVPAGVWRLTSWSMWGSSGSVNFLVLRPAGGTAYTVVYASPLRSLTGPGINTFPDSVAVLGGDKIAFEDHTTGLSCFIITGNAADTVGFNFQPATQGSTVNDACNGCETGVRWNLGATVEPITKDECKDGGWTSWPVFKNQGDCVSFVATDGRNPPG